MQRVPSIVANYAPKMQGRRIRGHSTPRRVTHHHVGTLLKQRAQQRQAVQPHRLCQQGGGTEVSQPGLPASFRYTTSARCAHHAVLPRFTLPQSVRQASRAEARL